MAKKKTDMFTMDDAEKLYALFRHVGPFREYEKDLIYSMYKKYINPDQVTPVDNCNCSLSYASLFGKLRDFVSENSEKFIN
jgi:hypothetical protein